MCLVWINNVADIQSNSVWEESRNIDINAWTQGFPTEYRPVALVKVPHFTSHISEHM